MKMKTVLVDKDVGMRSELANILEMYRLFEVVAEFDDVNLANDYVLSHAVDVLFVCLSVGDPKYSGDGSFMVSYLCTQKPDLLAVPYSEEVKDAYWTQGLGASAFFTIPMDVLRFQQVVQRLSYLFNMICIKRESENRSLMIKNKFGYQIAKFSDILYIECSNRKKKIVCVDGTEIEVLNYSMDELERLLADSSFFRCYQSFIVNLDKVSSVRIDSVKRTYALSLEGLKEEIMLGREKQKEIVERLKQRSANLQI